MLAEAVRNTQPVSTQTNPVRDVQPHSKRRPRNHPTGAETRGRQSTGHEDRHNSADALRECTAQIGKQDFKPASPRLGEPAKLRLGCVG